MILPSATSGPHMPLRRSNPVNFRRRMRASSVSLHGRKRGWRQQLAADVLDELAIILRLGDHRDPFGIGEKSAPALLTLGHAVPGEHVGDLLAALADQRGPKPDLADAVLLPDPQRLVLEP